MNQFECRRLHKTGNFHSNGPDQRHRRLFGSTTDSMPTSPVQTYSSQAQHPVAVRKQMGKMHAPPGIRHHPERRYLGVRPAADGQLIPIINDTPFFRHTEVERQEAPHEGLERMRLSENLAGGYDPYSTNTRSQLLATRRYESRLRENGALLNTGIGGHQPADHFLVEPGRRALQLPIRQGRHAGG